MTTAVERYMQDFSQGEHKAYIDVLAHLRDTLESRQTGKFSVEATVPNLPQRMVLVPAEALRIAQTDLLRDLIGEITEIMHEAEVPERELKLVMEAIAHKLISYGRERNYEIVQLIIDPAIAVEFYNRWKLLPFPHVNEPPQDGLWGNYTGVDLFVRHIGTKYVGAISHRDGFYALDIRGDVVEGKRLG